MRAYSLLLLLLLSLSLLATVGFVYATRQADIFVTLRDNHRFVVFQPRGVKQPMLLRVIRKGDNRTAIGRSTVTMHVKSEYFPDDAALSNPLLTTTVFDDSKNVQMHVSDAEPCVRHLLAVLLEGSVVALVCPYQLAGGPVGIPARAPVMFTIELTSVGAKDDPAKSREEAVDLFAQATGKKWADIAEAPFE